MTKLTEMKCEPCREDSPRVTDGEMPALKSQIPDWGIGERDGVLQLKKTFKFKDFSEALSFANKIGDLAEQEDHHPEIWTEWGRVTIFWWTHKIGGLHKNDFIMAAKTEIVHAAGL